MVPCETNALKALGDLLLEGDAMAKKVAAKAIFDLCMHHKNRVTAIKGGALRAVLKMLKDGQLVDELLPVAALISIEYQVTELRTEHHGVAELLQLLKDSNGSGEKEENFATILFSICSNDREALQEVKRHEDAHRTLAQLAQNGTVKAQIKANGILERLSIRRLIIR